MGTPHNSTRSLDRSVKILPRVLATLLTAGIIALLFTDPIPQDSAYHEFADQRPWFGIPRFGDTATNIFFVIVGALGLRFTISAAATRGPFTQPRERRAFLVSFAGVFLTGFGSAWYHLQPNNAGLIWDRLPMTLIFMGLFSAIISEHISPRAGSALLSPLVLAGTGSVAWWAWTEHLGAGDLRWYGLVQFFPLLAMAAMLLVLPSRYTHSKDYWMVLALYAAAKAAEGFDRQLLELSGIASGHSLKHVLAAAAAWWVLRMLKRRRGKMTVTRRTPRSTETRGEKAETSPPCD